MKTPIFLSQLGDNVINGINPSEGLLANVIKNLLTMVFVAGGLFLVYNLIMGALNWIMSAGEKEKVDKARKQITNALIGFIILMVVWFLFFAITSNIFGIFEAGPNGSLKLKLPSLFGP